MNHELEKTPEGPSAPGTRGRFGRAVMLVAGTIAFVLAAAGIVAAASGSSLPSGDPRDRSIAVPGPGTRATTVVPTTTAPTTTDPKPTAPPHSPSAQPVPDPTALADGTYPAYVRDVDVHDATITVDVVQVFNKHAAVEAAVEDGTPRRDARYLDIYLRNENDLLRALPVARDVRIHFMGVCESPANRHAALTELSEATTPFDTTFYYAITLTEGEIHHIVQHLAISAC